MSQGSPSVVVVVCGDPGGASAMAPILERLRARGSTTARALAYHEARFVWGRRRLEFEEISDGLTVADAADLLSSNQAAALVVGTSVNTVDLEKRFVEAAHQIGTPSLALLDYWSNYVQRFDDVHGALSCVPDRIAVMDHRAKAEMVELGFDPERLVVTGQPAFDDLPLVRARFTPSLRTSIRNELRAEAGDLLVAFVSQPLAKIYGSTSASPTFLGFTEDDVLTALAGALQRVSRRGVRVLLAVLPHPRQSLHTFEGVSSMGVDTVVSRRRHPLEVAMSSDLVVGMNSVLLVEACYLGCPTLSLQPGLRWPDTLPTNRLGVSKAVYAGGDVEPEVADLLLNADSRRKLAMRTSDFLVDVGATDRVVELIDALCAGSLVGAEVCRR